MQEFEEPSMGVPGPSAISKDKINQSFGFRGNGLKGFVEFIFDTKKTYLQVTFRLIDEFRNTL